MISLKSIKLTNYRNYEYLHLSLGSSTTILIGKNGTGKTNLITALKQSLSFIFSKKKDSLHYEFIASSDQKVKSFLSTDPRYVKNEEGGNYIYPIAVSVEMKINDTELKWELRRKTLDRGIDESYVDSCVKFWKQFPEFKELPVIAFFSDSYPHILANLGSKVQNMLDSGNPLPQNIAFYKWDEERNCTEIWKQYFIMNWKNHRYKKENDKLEKYIEAITSALCDFTKPISQCNDNKEFEIQTLEVEARGKDDVLVVVFKDGRRVPFDMLSQGYKRVLSIVFDLLHRSFILNGHNQSSGIVFIDEIELHLHPSLAQEIVARLKRSFKNIQFIISTHSPLVISEYKQDNANILYSITQTPTGVGLSTINNMYGLDYITVLRSVMDTPERDTYLANLVGAFQYWKKLNDTNRANKVAEKIRQLVGQDSEIYNRLMKNEIR